MCAARTGQLLNLSSLATDCGVSQGTARNWITILQASYVLFLLQPHHENFGKRLAGDAFDGLRRWLKFAGKKSARPLLVYGGEESFERSGIAVQPWLSFGNGQ